MDMTHYIFAFPSCLQKHQVTSRQFESWIAFLFPFSFISLPPSSCHSSPLADLSDPQDVGEEGLLLSDDHRLLQLPAVQKVFGQNSQRPQVRRLWCHNLKHTLPKRRWVMWQMSWKLRPKSGSTWRTNITLTAKISLSYMCGEKDTTRWIKCFFSGSHCLRHNLHLKVWRIHTSSGDQQQEWLLLTIISNMKALISPQ